MSSASHLFVVMIMSLLTCSIILTASVVFSHRLLNLTLVLFLISPALEQALACLPHHARKAHSIPRLTWLLRPLAHTSVPTLIHTVSAGTTQRIPLTFASLCGRLTAHLLPFSTHPHPTALTLGGRSKGSQVLTLVFGYCWLLSGIDYLLGIVASWYYYSCPSLGSPATYTLAV